MRLTAHGLPLLEATGLTAIFRDAFLGAHRKYITFGHARSASAAGWQDTAEGHSPITVADRGGAEGRWASLR